MGIGRTWAKAWRRLSLFYWEATAPWARHRAGQKRFLKRAASRARRRERIDSDD